MNRRVLNLLTALSLLLCVAVCVLWVHSYRVSEILEKSTREVYWRVELGSGELQWTHIDQTVFPGSIVEDTDAEGPYRYQRESPPLPPLALPRRQGDTYSEWFHVAGFFFRRQRDSTDDWPSTVVCVPLWAPAIAFAVLPTCWLYRRLRRRHPPGHCRRCGYDLTGNQSGTCPECGATADKPEA